MFDTTHEMPGINLGKLAVLSNKCLLVPGNYESVPTVNDLFIKHQKSIHVVCFVYCPVGTFYDVSKQILFWLLPVPCYIFGVFSWEPAQ